MHLLVMHTGGSLVQEIFLNTYRFKTGKRLNAKYNADYFTVYIFSLSVDKKFLASVSICELFCRGANAPKNGYANPRL
jgi:hypothetical protein